jgi:hypothetical protein
MRTCACGCGKELIRKRQRFYNKNKCRWTWIKKLRNRGVLPIVEHKHCAICGGLFFLFSRNSIGTLCENPECKAESNRQRLQAAGRATQRRALEKDALTEQTPYHYGTAPIALEMRQRAIEVCNREGYRI